MGSFLYEATDRSGKREAGRVQSPTLAAARHRLETQGYSHIQFHTDEQSEHFSRAHGSSPAEGVTAAQELRARKSGSSAVQLLVTAYSSTWMLWLPLLSWAAWLLYRGGPYGIGSISVFALAMAGLAFPVWASIPGIAYGRLLEASAWARWDDVIRCCDRIDRLRGWTMVGPALIDATIRRASAIAAKGDLPRALEIAQTQEAALQSRAVYLGRLNTVFGAARAWERMAQNQAEVVTLADRGTNEILDYATTLAWRMADADAADALLQEVAEREMSVLARAYFDFARGLVVLQREQWADADNLLRQSIQTLNSSGQNPLLAAMVDFANAYRVLALAGLGQRAAATALLRDCLPRLKAHHELELTRRCAAATVGHAVRA